MTMLVLAADAGAVYRFGIAEPWLEVRLAPALGRFRTTLTVDEGWAPGTIVRLHFPRATGTSWDATLDGPDASWDRSIDDVADRLDGERVWLLVGPTVDRLERWATGRVKVLP